MKMTNDDYIGIGEILKDLVEEKPMKANKDDCTYIKNSTKLISLFRLVPGIDQLHSTISWPGVHKIYNVVQLGLSPELP
jgi:hypothetical protein